MMFTHMDSHHRPLVFINALISMCRRFGGKRGYADMRVCGYADMQVCGMRVCGYADMRVCGYAGMRVCGYAGTSNWFNKQISKTH